MARHYVAVEDWNTKWGPYRRLRRDGTLEERGLSNFEAKSGYVSPGPIDNPCTTDFAKLTERQRATLHAENQYWYRQQLINNHVRDLLAAGYSPSE